jgi:hypothetical protein
MMVKPVVIKKRKPKREVDEREVGEPGGGAAAEPKKQDTILGLLEPDLELENWGFDDTAGF